MAVLDPSTQPVRRTGSEALPARGADEACSGATEQLGDPHREPRVRRVPGGAKDGELPREQPKRSAHRAHVTPRPARAASRLGERNVNGQPSRRVSHARGRRPAVLGSRQRQGHPWAERHPAPVAQRAFRLCAASTAMLGLRTSARWWVSPFPTSAPVDNSPYPAAHACLRGGRRSHVEDDHGAGLCRSDAFQHRRALGGKYPALGGGPVLAPSASRVLDSRPPRHACFRNAHAGRSTIREVGQ